MQRLLDNPSWRNKHRTRNARRRTLNVETLERRHLLAATPIGFWTFDDAGNIGADSSGSDNDLSAVGNATFAGGGVNGGALSLDGSGDYLAGAPNGLPVYDSATSEDSDYTISAWIKPETTGTRSVVSWGSSAIFARNTLGTIGDNGLRNDWNIINLRADSEVTAQGVDLDDGSWHHVAVAFGDASRALYLNGEEIKTQDTPIHFAVADDFRIGSGNGAEFWDGLLDEVAIWDRQLDGSQIAALARGISPLELREPGLVAQWVADDLNATMADNQAITGWTDQVLGVDVVPSGNVTFKTDELNGHSVLRFQPADGDDNLRIPQAVNPLGGAAGFSVAVVFRPSGTGVGSDTQWYDNSGLIDAVRPGITSDWGLAFNGAGQVGAGMGSPDVTRYSTNSVSFANGGAHVAIYTRDGNTLSLYMDDFGAVTRSDGATSLRGVSDLTIGSLQNDTGFFSGDIAEIQLYNKAIEANEAGELASNLMFKYGVVAPTVPIIVAGDLLVDLRATDLSAETATWNNLGSLGDFQRIGNPIVEVIDGVIAVSLNSDNPAGGFDDAYQGPIVPAGLTGDGLRTIEVWAYNPNDGNQQALETMVAWGRRGGPAGSNLAFAYGNHATWGALGQWGTPDLPWYPGGGSPTLGQWHHLVYTYDGSTSRVYADGEMTNSENYLLGTHGNTTINIGAQNGTSGLLDLAGGEPGALSLANVRIHTGVLSANEIALNFASGVQVAVDPPVTIPDQYTTAEDEPLVVAAPGLLSNDIDPAMAELIAFVDEAPANGSLALDPDGGFVYTPNPNFHGPETFSYRASNGLSASSPTEVTIDVTAVYDAAVAVNDTYVVDLGRAFDLPASGVLANDTNVDMLPLSAELVSDSTPGLLNLSSDGSFTYDPQGSRGDFAFRYRVDDGVSPSDAATVTLVVDAAPVAAADMYAATEDQTLTVNAANGVLQGDSDGEDDSMTAELVEDVQNGELTLNSNGSFVYVPDDNFFGTDTFTYRVSDGDQYSVPAMVTLNVSGVNDAPVSAADNYFGFQDQALVVSVVQGVLSNDLDVDGPALQAVLVDPPDEGDLTLNLDGSFTYLPVAGFLGNTSFTYKTSDTIDESATSTAHISISSLDQQIVINEVHYDPPDNRVPAEFIELFNAGTTRVDMSSWFFSKGVGYTFPAGTVIQPDDYVVVAQSPSTINAQFRTGALGPWEGKLANEGELIELRNAAGDVVDRVDFGVAFPWPTGAAGDGGSMELLHPSLDNDLGGSWRTSQLDSRSVPADPIILIPEVTAARYFVPGDNNLGTSWTAVGFDDAAWAQGETGLGYENTAAEYQDLINTRIRPTEVVTNSTSLFVRIPFTVDDLSEVSALRLRMKYDDGFVAYINGTEVARANIAGSPPPYNGAATNHPDASAVSFENFDFGNNTLVAGDNLLAIQVQNTSVGSSDMLVIAELRTPDPSVTFAAPSPGAVNSTFTSNAPPQTRQADHSPNEPTSTEETVITMKVTDPDGVANVDVQYQVVLPGQYIPAHLPNPISLLLSDPEAEREPNPEYHDPANWITLRMVDDGSGNDDEAGDGVYTATIPAQGHRSLVRYRVIVEDTLGAAVQVPYKDDASLNFAYFVYDGIPDYQTNVGTFSTDVLKSLPVYHFITRDQDMDVVLAYSGADQIAQGPEARFVYNWPGTMVYDGKVYDNIRYRLRGANGRYYVAGKRSMRFRFNKGNYFQARDQDGETFPVKWRTLTTGKGFDNRATLTYALNEAMSLHLYNEIGVPGSETLWSHFRVIDEAEEAPDQYHGDFWGMNFIVETNDVRFLDNHGLEKGNLYKLINSRTDWASQQRYQAPNAVGNGEDFNWIEQQLTGNTPADQVAAHVDLDKYYLYLGLAQAIRHYDYWPNANKNMVYYFEPEYTAENDNLGQLWILPWDTDASWGPTWNSGHDVVYNSLFPSGGAGGDGGSNPELWPDYYNVVREIRDLLWQQDQIEPLIDEVASPIVDFVAADNARWKGAPSSAGNYNGLGGAGATSLAALIQDMKNFAFVGGNWPGGSVGPGGRGAFLDQLQAANGEGAEIPFTPTIVYTGDPSFTTDSLSFESSTFQDPQGDDTFVAMEWRLAKVTDPNAPAYDPTAKMFLEWHADWESGEITTFSHTIEIPAGEVEAGHSYRARVRMQDTSGRWSHWSDPVSFITTPPDAASLQQQFLRISEVNYNPLGSTSAEIVAGFDDSDQFEFIEVVNTSPTSTLDLNGVSFQRVGGDGVDFEFTGSSITSLAAGDRLVIVEDLAAFALRYGSGVSVAGEWSGGLSNSGELITLVDSAGEVILSFEYSDGGDFNSRADGDGSTLEIIDTAIHPSNGSNWAPSSMINGSPGVAGDPAETRVVINEVLTNTDLPQLDAIELHNTSNQPVDIGGWFLSDANGDALAFGKFRIPVGTIIQADGYVVFDESDFNRNGPHNPHPDPPAPNEFGIGSTGDELWLTAGDGIRPTHFVDGVEFGGQVTGQSFGLVEGSPRLEPMSRVTLGCGNGAMRPGNVVISEIMYQPLDASAEELELEPNLDDNDLEYLEIVNPTGSIIDLSGWRMRGGVSFEFPDGTILAAGEFLVVMSFDPAVAANANKVQVFAGRYGVDMSSGFVGGYNGSLYDFGENLELQRPEVATNGTQFFVLEDRVDYGAPGNWVRADGNSESIQRQKIIGVGSQFVHWQRGEPSPQSYGSELSPTTNLTGNSAVVDDADIDMLLEAIHANSTNVFFDVDGNGAVDSADVDRLLSQLNVFAGDANLDGTVNSLDLNQVGIHWQQANCVSWSRGDFTGDGAVTSADLNVLGINWQRKAAAATTAADEAAFRPRAALEAINLDVLDVIVANDFVEQDPVRRDFESGNVPQQPEPIEPIVHDELAGRDDLWHPDYADQTNSHEVNDADGGAAVAEQPLLDDVFAGWDES